MIHYHCQQITLQGTILGGMDGKKMNHLAASYPAQNKSAEGESGRYTRGEPLLLSHLTAYIETLIVFPVGIFILLDLL